MRSLVTTISAVLLATSVLGQEVPVQDDVVHDQLLVQMVQPLPELVDPYDDQLDSTGDAEVDRLLEQAGAVSMRRIVRRPPRGWRNPEAMAVAGVDRWVEVSLAAEDANILGLAGRIAEHPAVEEAVAQRIRHAFDTTPDDPNFGQQWSLQNNRMRAPKAWDHGTDSPVVVAITDTGCDMDHPDIQDNIWINTGEIRNNGIDDDGNGYVDDRKGWDFAYGDRNPDDQFGHGVHVAGIVGAVGDNGRQVSGTCWSVPLMICKALNDGGGGFDSDLSECIVYAADNGAGVVNMSWGGTSSGGPIRSAIDYAAAADVCLVAAAGNFGSQTKVYPAAYGKVMAVISTNSGDSRSNFSTYGSWCDMAAPGEDILNTYLNGTTARLSGTSMASPHVAGAAALVWAANPAMDSGDVRWLLNYSANDLGGAGFDNSYGWGRLNLLRAVNMARALVPSDTVVQPGGQVQLALDVAGGANDIHILLPSFEGRRPGTSLNGFDPADHRQIAINYDALLFPYLLTHPNSAIFDDFIGTLDASGQGSATLNVPGGPLFSGRTMTIVGLTFDPANLNQVEDTTTSVQVRIQ